MENVAECEIAKLFGMKRFVYDKHRQEFGLDRNGIILAEIDKTVLEYGEEIRTVLMRCYYYNKFKRVSNAPKGNEDLFVNGIVRLSVNTIQNYINENAKYYGTGLTSVMELAAGVSISRYMRKQKETKTIMLSNMSKIN